jgi:predicted RNA-binding Zn-ribbon protein involved in translation (DUF1610 family)
MATTAWKTTEDQPRSLAALRRSRAGHRQTAGSLPSSSTVDHCALRETRLDKIAASKRKLWINSLRLTQLVNLVLITGSVLFIMWQSWSYRATALAALFASSGMWLFARRMAPQEERLRRLMVSLARRRRACVICGYLLRDLTGNKCPECGTDFDPHDDRHVLAAETLHLVSSRARSVSALVIVFAMFWMSALVQGSPWPVHVAIALALLVAFHLLHAFWIWQARRMQPPLAHRHVPTCPGCQAALSPVDRSGRSEPRPSGSGARVKSGGDLPKACPTCSQPLTYADVFIRPDARRLADRRARRLQYHTLLLRWVFLMLMFAGLACLVAFGGALLRIPTFGLGRAGFILRLTIPVLFWVTLVAVPFRYLGKRLHRRSKLLSAQIGPECPRCRAALSSQAVGHPCPGCGRDIHPMYIRG